jgi:hypothetical protein
MMMKFDNGVVFLVDDDVVVVVVLDGIDDVLVDDN